MTEAESKGSEGVEGNRKKDATCLGKKNERDTVGLCGVRWVVGLVANIPRVKSRRTKPDQTNR